jgi:geranylgeranyl pyrophosphate synthase
MTQLGKTFLAEAAGRVDAELDRLLPPASGPDARLHEAMRYSTLSPGKRLRPALALASCRAFGGDEDACLAPAAALEMVHAYSLIHDDLPAMDDDDLRRGRPTNHVVYGEAIAILAGDGLHTLACEVLATRPEGDAWLARRARAQAHVLSAIGWRGMVGGQAIDIELTGRGGAASEDDVRGIHLRKTAALIRAALVLGAELAGAPGDEVAKVARFGDLAGLAFQVVDDVLDVTTDAATLGKTQGKDAEEGKVTYPAVLGLEGAQREAVRLCSESLDALRGIAFTGDSAPLEALTRFILERRS